MQTVKLKEISSRRPTRKFVSFHTTLICSGSEQLMQAMSVSFTSRAVFEKSKHTKTSNLYELRRSDVRKKTKGLLYDLMSKKSLTSNRTTQLRRMKHYLS